MTGFKKYDPETFWDKATEVFCGSEMGWREKLGAEHTVLFEWIDKLQPASILTVGIGFGKEIKPLLTKPYIKQLVGVDISDKMLAVAKTYIGALPSTVTIEKGDVRKLKYRKDIFDLVFTVSLLTHIPRDDINKTLSELIRVSKKHLILVELPVSRPDLPGYVNELTYLPFLMDNPNIPNHFQYNYPMLFANQKVRMIEDKRDLGDYQHAAMLLEKL